MQTKISFISVTTKCLRLESSFFRQRSRFLTVSCYLDQKETSWKDKMGVEVTSSCAYRSYVHFSGSELVPVILLVFHESCSLTSEYFQVSANDLYHRLWPKENPACHVSQLPKEWMEVWMDEEKIGKEWRPKTEQFPQPENCSNCWWLFLSPPLQCIPWWMGHLILRCLRVSLECILSVLH